MQQRWLQQKISPGTRGPLSPEAKQEVKQEVMEEVGGLILELKEELAAARAQAARAELEAVGAKESLERASAASKAAKEEQEAKAAREAEAKAHAKAAKAAAKAAKEEEGDRAHEHGRPVPVEPALSPAPVVGAERHPQRGAARIQRGGQVWQPRQQVRRRFVIVKPRAHAQRRARDARPVGR